MLKESAPLFQDAQAGRFKVLTPEEVLAETCMMLKYAKPTKPCIFRSNHASNYVSLKGTLPADNDSMIASLKHCMEDRGLLKDERFRML
jgi:hypothetical protein